MEKSTISMAMFNSFLFIYQAGYPIPSQEILDHIPSGLVHFIPMKNQVGSWATIPPNVITNQQWYVCIQKLAELAAGHCGGTAGSSPNLAEGFWLFARCYRENMKIYETTHHSCKLVASKRANFRTSTHPDSLCTFAEPYNSWYPLVN